jgi:hypothetical protein
LVIVILIRHSTLASSGLRLARARPTTTAAELAEARKMIFGMTTYTLVHVVLSLVGILSGAIVLIGLLGARRLDGWTALFLATTVATSATGFGFPFVRLLPSHVIGIISLVVLAVAILALYVFRLAGAWRWIYVVSAMIAFYLNVFVLIFQAFLKVPSLQAMAPTQSEPPFLITQLAAMAVIVVLTIVAAIRFRPGLVAARTA